MSTGQAGRFVIPFEGMDGEQYFVCLFGNPKYPQEMFFEGITDEEGLVQSEADEGKDWLTDDYINKIILDNPVEDFINE